MSALAGTRALVRFHLRRDRVIVPAYVVLMVLMIVSTAVQSEELYSTQAERDEYAATIGTNAGMVALVGPAYAVTTVGGDVAWQFGGIGAVVAALVSMLLVGRHTRAEEQSGRSELVRASAVGRFAPLVAALLVATIANALLALCVGLALTGQGLDAEGSFALGASIAAVGLAFAGVAAVVAQLSQATSGMYGLVGAVLGGAYVLRAAGDVGDGTLSWLSPVGWGQAVRPFAGERWWPLLLLVAATALLVAVALVLVGRRDDGAGVLAERPGPRGASPGLTRTGGLALRLQRGSLIGWVAGLFLAGVAIGSIAQDADSLLGDSGAVQDLYAAAGGSAIDNYLALSVLSMAQVATAFAIAAVLRLRGEEGEGRAEVLLATALSRRRWVGAQAAVALAGSVLAAAAIGLGAGIADAIVAGDAGRLPRLLAASLATVPAIWVMAGLATALFGLVPRAALAAWGALAACFLLAFLGPLLSLPGWVLDLSPYEHVPRLPAADFELLPLLALTAVAALLVAIGLAGFRRRDLRTA